MKHPIPNPDHRRSELVVDTSHTELSSHFQLNAKPRHYLPIDASLIPDVKYRDGIGIAPHPGG